MSETLAQASCSVSTSSSDEAESSMQASQSNHVQDEGAEAAAAALLEGERKEEALEHLCFLAKHSNTSTEVRLSIKDTVAELKAVLFDMTDIPPDRQKILGLVKGKLPTDGTKLGDVQFPHTSLRASPNPTTGEKRITITLIGTPLELTFKDPGANEALHDVSGASESLDIDYSDMKYLHLDPVKDPRSLAKLEEAVSRFSFTFPVMNEPREGLKGGLLVLDLDYTIADTKRLLNYHTTARESERPGLHEFLAAVYPYYDIVVWSQTRHFWLEAKLTELGCLTDERYKISFVLDRTPMFSITPPHGKQRGGAISKHQVKALEIIWRRFPNYYGPHNTIHVDDLSRNFAMNPTCGLKIKAYRDSPSPDHELADLQEYLIRLAKHGLDTFEQLGGHKQWKKLLHDEKKKSG